MLYSLLKLSIPGSSCHLMIGPLWGFIKVDKGYMNFIVRKHITIVNHLIIMLGHWFPTSDPQKPKHGPRTILIL